MQVLVNGETILSCVNSASYVIHHGSGKMTNGGKNVAGNNLTGLTLVDFLALPARARIQISYSGGNSDKSGLMQKNSQGFLSMKKL